MGFEATFLDTLKGFPNLFGLIGYPLGHSFSRKYFREKFERGKLDGYEYALFPMPSIEWLPELVAALPNLRGLNVTIPYKQAVMPYLDELDPGAAEVGAVNVVRRSGNRLVGYNSDVAGFREDLLSFLGGDVEAFPTALVLGTGGASRAVVYVLRHLGIKPLLVSRTATPEAIAYEDVDERLLSEHRLVIHTTPLGMSPDTDAAPDLPYQVLGPSHYLYDLVYNPLETKFMQIGKAQGAQVCNGLGMLYGQAERAWEIWNEVKP
ncbi:MAG: shikimate dehydrogenase family protein [Haliscomenobacter sp.]